MKHLNTAILAFALGFIPQVTYSAVSCTPRNSNPYSTCNGENCTYWAWSQAAKSNKWDQKLPGWGDAKTWLKSAKECGFPIVYYPQSDAIAVDDDDIKVRKKTGESCQTICKGNGKKKKCNKKCEPIYKESSFPGHVAWVLESKIENGELRVKVSEMNYCEADGKAGDKWFPASKFDGYILKKH